MIHKNWAELIKPQQLDVKPGVEPARQATLIAEPLERGFGLTLGNALRRILMSSLQGAAITSVSIDNVLHEFSSIAGVREDVTDVVLNLKGVSLRMDVEGPKRLSIAAKGPKVVTAADISESAGIDVLNKEHVICHLDDGADLFMELTVNSGKGYVSAEKNKPEDAPIGLIPVDAIYSPVKKVSYDVQPTREGQVLDYDNLTTEINLNVAAQGRSAIHQLFDHAVQLVEQMRAHIDSENHLARDNVARVWVDVDMPNRAHRIGLVLHRDLMHQFSNKR